MQVFTTNWLSVFLNLSMSKSVGLYLACPSLLGSVGLASLNWSCEWICARGASSPEKRRSMSEKKAHSESPYLRMDHGRRYTSANAASSSTPLSSPTIPPMSCKNLWSFCKKKSALAMMATSISWSSHR
ncbi:hypothetical protein OG21DRAFT_218043 [Imleria badia]|nr:hypothetical protein OG21DRAFT_218043 [Imleria badia]